MEVYIHHKKSKNTYENVFTGKVSHCRLLGPPHDIMEALGHISRKFRNWLGSFILAHMYITTFGM